MITPPVGIYGRRSMRSEEATMTMQPGGGPAIPAVAAAAGVDDDTSSGATDDGTPVGSADAEADAERTGADDAGDWPDSGKGSGLLNAETGDVTPDAEPVGAADLEADKARSRGEDDTQ
jgi:hypothetical protein